MTAFDHVAVQVTDLDAFVSTVTRAGVMDVLRWGTHGPSGRRLVMLVDAAGHKVEVVEGDSTRLLHLAFEVDDVAGSFDALITSGATAERPPYRIDGAKAWSAVATAPSGIELQVVRYDPDSPDRTS